MLIGLWNVLQPYCLGEGTNFFQYLFLGVNSHTLKAKNLIGIGFVKLFATRTALGFGFVGGKFFPTMRLAVWKLTSGLGASRRWREKCREI